MPELRGRCTSDAAGWLGLAVWFNFEPFPRTALRLGETGSVLDPAICSRSISSSSPISLGSLSLSLSERVKGSPTNGSGLSFPMLIKAVQHVLDWADTVVSLENDADNQGLGSIVSLNRFSRVRLLVMWIKLVGETPCGYRKKRVERSNLVMEVPEDSSRDEEILE